MKERHEGSDSRGELRANGAANELVEKSAEARGLSQTMRDPARRKRSVVRPNGHGGAASSLIEPPNEAKTNGKQNGSVRAERESAASDDATGATLAGDAAPSSAAACSGRDACAEVAAPRSRSRAVRDEESGIDDDRRPRASDDLEPKAVAQGESANPTGFSATKKQKKAAGQIRPSATKEKETKEYPPGVDEPLALDAPGFVEEMHERVNLYEVYKDLLTSGDLKVKQRATEFLMEMKYGKGAASGADEITRVDVEFPKPE